MGRKPLYKRVAGNFVQGFLALLPLLITWYLFMFIFRLVESRVDKILVLIPVYYRQLPGVVPVIEAVAVVALFLAIAMFGRFVKTFVGKSLLNSLDNFFEPIPLFSTIYRAARQAIEFFQIKKDRFLTHPVLVEWPQPGCFVVAFNTGELDAKMSPDGKAGTHFTVFIPTTPNPTSGYLAVVPSSKLRSANISVEEAVKLVLTGGMVKGE